MATGAIRSVEGYKDNETGMEGSQVPDAGGLQIVRRGQTKRSAGVCRERVSVCLAEYQQLVAHHGVTSDALKLLKRGERCSMLTLAIVGKK